MSLLPKRKKFFFISHLVSPLSFIFFFLHFIDFSFPFFISFSFSSFLCFSFPLSFSFPPCLSINFFCLFVLFSLLSSSFLFSLKRTNELPKPTSYVSLYSCASVPWVSFRPRSLVPSLLSLVTHYCHLFVIKITLFILCIHPVLFIPLTVLISVNVYVQYVCFFIFSWV